MSIPNIAANQVKSSDHVHTYKRHPLRKGYSYCLGSVCHHVQATKLLVGKLNKCKCGKEFILTREDLRRAVPRCINCSVTKKALERKQAKSVFETLIGGSDKTDINKVTQEEIENDLI